MESSVLFKPKDIRVVKQDSFVGPEYHSAYSRCHVCGYEPPCFPVSKMMEILVFGRKVQTVVRTPLMVCPVCAEVVEGCATVEDLADLLVGAESMFYPSQSSESLERFRSSILAMTE